MYDIPFWSRFMFQNKLKDKLAHPMINHIKITLQKNEAWLRAQEQYR